MDFHSASTWFESSFSPDLSYPLTVGVEGYCCTWSHSMTHTHTHTHTHNTQKDSSGLGIGQSQRSVPAQHPTLTANILDLGGIRNHHPSKCAATDPRRRPSQLIYKTLRSRSYYFLPVAAYKFWNNTVGMWGQLLAMLSYMIGPNTRSSDLSD